MIENYKFNHHFQSENSETAKFYSGNTELTGINKVLPQRFASLEIDSYNPITPRKFLLDEANWFISDIQTDENCEFETEQVITITFDTTINFYTMVVGADSNITGYIELFVNETSVNKYSFTKELENVLSIDNMNYIFNGGTPSDECNKIVIHITDTSTPNRFLNVWSIIFGLSYDITDLILDCSANLKSSVTGRELPIDTLTLTLTELPEYTSLDTHQTIYVTRNDETYQFFLTKFEEEENGAYKLEYEDCLTFLDENYDGNFFNNWSLLSIFKDILGDTKIDYELGEYASKPLSGWIAPTTKRNALIYLQNALGVKFNKHPFLSLYKESSDDIVHSFNDENILQDGYSVTEETPCRSVNTDLYKLQVTTKEAEEVVKGYYEAGTHSVSLSNPVYVYGTNLSTALKAYTSEDMTTSATITSSSLRPYTLTFTVPKECYVVFKVTKFWNTAKYLTKHLRIKNYEAYTKRSEENITTFTLWADTDTINEVSENMYKYYTQFKKTIKFSSFEDFQEQYRQDLFKIYDEYYRMSECTIAFDGTCELECDKVAL